METTNNMPILKPFTFEKKCRGALSIVLDSYNFTAPEKTFFFDYNVDRIVVPYIYALGLFVSQSARQQNRLGYFEVIDYEGLVKEANKYGIYDEQSLPKVNRFDEVRNIILSGDARKLADLLKKADNFTQSVIVGIAVDNLGKLSQSTIKAIETASGVALTIEE